MDDDWSDEEVVEQQKEILESADSLPEDHVEELSPAPLAPHLPESAALSRMAEKPEETIIVSKNERFADVTYDRRDTRSPDDSIHGQRQIYNPKLGRFENVEAQPGRDIERHSRKNIEIMQRGQGRRGSSSGRRRDSLAKGEEVRQSKGLQMENRGYSPLTQRRTSLVDRDQPSFLPHDRRDSFVSTSGVSDGDRSVSNASPGVDTLNAADQVSPIDLIALQQKEMAESRKRALERRAKDEEERAAAAERARKKAAELAVKATADASPNNTEVTKSSPVPAIDSPVQRTVSPMSQRASPVPPRPSPMPVKASPLSSQASPATSIVKPTAAENALAKPTHERRDSALWAASRDQEEIIISDSHSKEEPVSRRSAWGPIGSSQKAASHKHSQNGLFNNPNTLATLNHTIGGDASHRGRNVTRPSRTPITPTNVPPSLQGWATFAGNLETRKAHDDERQQERNQERERIERERGGNAQRSANLVDKWRKVEIKEPENAGDIAGRTVVSVLKSGYIEDSSGNLQVKESSIQKIQSEASSTTTGISNVLSPEAAAPLTGRKSPALDSSAQALGIQTPAQPTVGDKTPVIRDRSRFFPSSTSTVIDISPRAVHPSQPTNSDKSVFPPASFSSFDDMSKSPSSAAAVSPLTSTTTSFGTNPQGSQPPQRQPITSLSQFGQVLPTSPGQALAAAPQMAGTTSRNTFPHSGATTSALVQASYKAKLPSVEDFDTVLARLRESMQTSHREPIGDEDATDFTCRDSIDPQIQTRTDSYPADSDRVPYIRISAVSPHRDLEISTRDLDEEPLTHSAVKVSLPKILYTSSRDLDLPIDVTSSPKVKLPIHVAPRPETPDAKFRLRAIDNQLSSTPFHRTSNTRPPQAFKIQFAPSLRPKGGVVPNLVKRDRFGAPYVNFEAKPEALRLPAYGHDNEVFYTHRDYPNERSYVKHNKFPKFNKNQSSHRKSPKSDHGEASSTGHKVVADPSRHTDKT